MIYFQDEDEEADVSGDQDASTQIVGRTYSRKDPISMMDIAKPVKNKVRSI